MTFENSLKKTLINPKPKETKENQRNQQKRENQRNQKKAKETKENPNQNLVTSFFPPQTKEGAAATRNPSEA